MKKGLLYVLFLILSVHYICAETQTTMEDILVIHSYHLGFRWTDSVSRGIHSVLDSENVEIHHEFLDTKRNAGEEYYQLLLDFEKRKKELSNTEFKLIICTDNNALVFIMEYGETLYPGVPVIFCGINNFSPEMIEGRNDITGVVESINYKANLELIKDLHPDRKNILVVIDQSATGFLLRKELESVIMNDSNEFTFEIFQDFALDEVPDKISSLGEKDVILLVTLNRDKEGRFISNTDGIEFIHNYADVPVYGFWDYFFGQGIIGGVLTTGQSQGAAAAGLAKELLDGTSIYDLDIIRETPNQMMFDYNELKRFDINLKQLPHDSFIINKPESLIKRAAYYILAVSVLTLFILCIAVLRLIQHRFRERQLKIMNTELEKRVQQKTADLTEKVSELQTALEQIKTLQGIIPMCSKCKKIRNDKGYWNQVEQYISEHTDAEFTHGLCPDCFDQLYRDAKARKEQNK